MRVDNGDYKMEWWLFQTDRHILNPGIYIILLLLNNLVMYSLVRFINPHLLLDHYCNSNILEYYKIIMIQNKMAYAAVHQVHRLRIWSCQLVHAIKYS